MSQYYDMAIIILYPTYFRIFVFPYSSIFFGSNLLYPSGPFRFIMDKGLIINLVEEELTEILSKATVQKTIYKLEADQKENLSNLLGQQEKYYNLSYHHMSLEDQKKKTNDFLLNVSERVFGFRSSPFIIIKGSLSKLFEEPNSDDFRHGTNFGSYRLCLFQIVEKLFQEGHEAKLEGFSKGVTDEETFAIFQQVRKINVEIMDYLNRTQNANPTSNGIKEYVSIYDTISGSYEKYIRNLRWMNEIFEGQVPEYHKIKFDSLSNHVDVLKRRPLFQVLVEPINVKIRNALSHKTYLIDPLTETITFIDHRVTVVKGYQEFIRETRELASAWSIVSKIGFAITLNSLRIHESRLSSSFEGGTN
jgi:hypothetical protein